MIAGSSGEPSPTRSEMPRVIQIGFNRCGTRSIAGYFEANGIPAVHWRRGRLAQAMFRNWTVGSNLFEGFLDYQIFTDMEHVSKKEILEGYKLFPVLAHQFPDAVFILNTRRLDDWLASRLRAKDGAYAKRWQIVLHLANNQQVIDVWRQSWLAHHEAVRAFFTGNKYRFLEFDIDQDDAYRLNAALPEFGLDAHKWAHLGKTGIAGPTMHPGRDRADSHPNVPRCR